MQFIILSQNFYNNHFLMKNNELIKILENEGIPYAVIHGEYDDASYKLENNLFVPDIDIVLQTKSRKIISILKSKKNFNYLGNNSFIYNVTNTRIDLYFNYLNVGYYSFLKVDKLSFASKEISKAEYIVYQILDPLLKFLEYHPRHQFRLRKYFSQPIPKEVKTKLDYAIGWQLSNALLCKIKDNNFTLSKLFIKRCKLQLLFINGNFVKMLKVRIFNNV